MMTSNCDKHSGWMDALLLGLGLIIAKFITAFLYNTAFVKMLLPEDAMTRKIILQLLFQTLLYLIFFRYWFVWKRKS